MVNPVAVLSHLVAIAVAFVGGFWVMGAITPDNIPDADVAPAVEVVAEPEQVEPDDANSLFQPAEFNEALETAQAQVAGGEDIVAVLVTPAELTLDTQEDAPKSAIVDVDDIFPFTPLSIASEIIKKRPELESLDLAVMSSLELRLSASSGEVAWRVDLVGEAEPPRVYEASFDGHTVSAPGP